MDAQDSDPAEQSCDRVARRDESAQILAQTMAGNTAALDVNIGDAVDVSEVQDEDSDAVGQGQEQDAGAEEEKQE
eukprot:2510347-Alexandrium_andersonii.AAC.1